MSGLQLKLLGGFELRSASGAAIPLAARKPALLLAYLALRPGQPHGRETLAGLFWGDSDDIQARKSLRQALVVLRQHLRPDEGVLVTPEAETVALAPDALTTDVAELEGALKLGTREALERAVALYDGELLEGYRPHEPLLAEWLTTERRHRREQALAAMTRLLDLVLAEGASEAGIGLALRILALDSLQESAHRALMRLYARQGRRGAALTQYRICRETLERELGVAPEPETQRLYKELRDQRAIRAMQPRASSTSVVPGTEPPAEIDAPQEAIEDEPMGRHRVVGVSEPSETRRVGLDTVAAAPARRGAALWAWLLLPPAAIATILLTLYTAGWVAPVRPATAEPSIAVLPFDNLSGNADDAYLADGFAEDIITELARNGELTVMARNTSFSFRGQQKRVEEIGRELGVRYVLEGSVRRTGDTLRLTIQLVDGTGRGHVWVERYDIGAAQIVATQDEIVRRTAATLFSEVRHAEKAAALRSSPGSFDVYTLTLKGFALKHQFTPEAYREGRRVLQRAIELAPAYAPAYAHLGHLDASDCAAGYSGEKRAEDIDDAIMLIRKALHLEPDRAYFYQALGFALSVKGRAQEALAAMEKAVALGPGDADNHMLHGRELATNGRFAEAVAAGEKAFTLNPVAPISYHAIQARSLYGTGAYEAALTATIPCVERNSGNRGCRAIRAAALVELGRHPEARAEIGELLARASGFTLKHAEIAAGYAGDSATNARLLERLREAGLSAAGRGES
jgi:TolB-like protein/DNA-binding SARP family transcriptional activator/Flp pilus assembly protein TadD